MMNSRRESPDQCFFCQHNDVVINYEDIELLKKYISNQQRILPPMRTGLCAKHQRAIAKSIKRARQAALLPYVP